MSIFDVEMSGQPRPSAPAGRQGEGSTGPDETGGRPEGGNDDLRIAGGGPSGGDDATRSLLHAVLDALPDGVCVLDCRGAIVHRNAALSRFLEPASDRAQLQPVLELVRRSASREGGERAADAEREGDGDHTVPAEEAGAARRDRPASIANHGVRAAGYIVTAEVVAATSSPLPGGGELVVVHVRPDTTRVADPAVVAQRFGLTHRQAQVALLLARGLRNKAIAEQLAVTEHTARRHTERVLARLGVSSRAQIAALLAGGE